MSNWEVNHIFNHYFRMETSRFLNLLNKQSFGNHASHQLSIFEIPEIELTTSEKQNYQFKLTLHSHSKNLENIPVYYSREHTFLGEIFFASIDNKVCQCTFEAAENGYDRLKKNYPKSELIQSQLEIHQNIAHLINNEDLEHPIELEVKGTSFQLQVWQFLTQIPSGETSTYGKIAHQFGDPNLARAIGTAVGANPVAVLIPCHRVIAQTGTIGKFRWGTPLKKLLLTIES